MQNIIVITDKIKTCMKKHFVVVKTVILATPIHHVEAFTTVVHKILLKKAIYNLLDISFS